MEARKSSIFLDFLMSEDMLQFNVKRIAGPIEENSAAVFLSNEQKTFVIFVGLFEAAAIIKEINKQTTIRPLTHDIINNILVGFDIEVKEIIISRIVHNTFCATIVLEQKIMDSEGKWTGKTRCVHLDARASDSIVVALKSNKPILVTKEVYEKVVDVSEMPISSDASDKQWEETDLGNIEFKMPNNDSHNPTPHSHPKDAPPEENEGQD